MSEPSGAIAGVTRATLAKDLRLEWRSKDAINSMLFFSLLVVVVFSFSFDPMPKNRARLPGDWYGLRFSCRGGGAQPDLGARAAQSGSRRLSRFASSANSLFLAKALGNFIFVAVLEMLMTPLFIMFYKLRPLGPAWPLIPIAGLGTWAIVVNGTFFAAMSLRTRSREIMLPLLLFPVSIPALLAMVNATTAILTGELSLKFWIVLLTTYDVVFTIACLLLFELVLHAE